MFRLWAWDAVDGRPPAFGMDAIVGRASRTQTPVFMEDLREVIFRPYWNVPPSILRGEILPALRRDPDYLRKHDMEVVRGTEHDPLDVRQRPGAKNALGLVKFVFPNDDNVYMHGTPATELFARRRRDFSHGCVRVADPAALAEWVLRDLPDWTRARIETAMAGPGSTSVKLPRPITVVLFYTTAAVTPDDGRLHFVDDIYRHDARLDRALRARRQSN